MFQGNDEGRTAFAELRLVVQGEPPQNFFSFRSQVKQHFSAIFAATMAPNTARGSQSVDQFDGAMVLDLEPLGEIPNSRPRPSRQAL